MPLYSWTVLLVVWKVRTSQFHNCVKFVHIRLGMVHVSNIQQGARANSAADLLSRNQPVKVKVMSVAGNRISLSMKDVDQVTGNDLTPHLRIKSEAELAEEEVLFKLTVSHCSMIQVSRGSVWASMGRVVRMSVWDELPLPLARGTERDSMLHHRTRSPDKRALWAHVFSR